jgi:hypothetical protein
MNGEGEGSEKSMREKKKKCKRGTRYNPVVIPIDLLSSHFSSLENSMLLDI